MTFRLEMEGFEPFEGIFAYERTAAGTRVTWTDRGDVGGNPLMRWMALAMDPMMGPTFEKGLADLEAAAKAAK
jgi:hypothetical protein